MFENWQLPWQVRLKPPPALVEKLVKEKLSWYRYLTHSGLLPCNQGELARRRWSPSAEVPDGLKNAVLPETAHWILPRSRPAVPALQGKGRCP